MKSIFTSLLIIGFASVTLTSCIKEYNCKCEIEYTGAPGLPKNTVTEYTIKDTHGNAKSQCEGSSNEYTSNGMTTIEDCKLF